MASHPARNGQRDLEAAKDNVPARTGKGARSASAAAVGAVYGVRTAGDVMNRRPPIADQDPCLWRAGGRLRGADCRHPVVVDSQLHPVGGLDVPELALRWPPGPCEAYRVARPVWCADRPGHGRAAATMWRPSPGPCWPPTPTPFRWSTTRAGSSAWSPRAAAPSWWPATRSHSKRLAVAVLRYTDHARAGDSLVHPEGP
jgi:hypothetical protein